MKRVKRVLYVMHGIAITGEIRHHFGTTTQDRFRARCREHWRHGVDPFDKWAREHAAIIEFQIIAYDCDLLAERVYNAHPAPEDICPFCRELNQPLPF